MYILIKSGLPLLIAAPPLALSGQTVAAEVEDGEEAVSLRNLSGNSERK